MIDTSLVLRTRLKFLSTWPRTQTPEPPLNFLQGPAQVLRRRENGEPGAGAAKRDAVLLDRDALVVCARRQDDRVAGLRGVDGRLDRTVRPDPPAPGRNLANTMGSGVMPCGMRRRKS